jgi:hypothetical protein
MEPILKQYDDMRIMRMIKKELMNCDISLGRLKKEYEDKDDQLLILGIKKEVTKHQVEDTSLEEIKIRLEELKTEIEGLEEDKRNLAVYNSYTGR